jgi:uncharacterized protein YkwD
MILSGVTMSTIHAASSSDTPLTQQELNSNINEILRLVNIERGKVGLNPLVLDTDLNNAANVRSKDITKLFDHKRPNGSQIFSLSAKIYGENIASGQSTAKQVMNGWMKSPSHKANILNPSFTTMV